jgi:hypothetical protein
MWGSLTDETARFHFGCGIVVLLIVFGGSLWNWYLARKAGPEALGRVPEFNLARGHVQGPTMVGSQDLRVIPGWPILFSPIAVVLAP